MTRELIIEGQQVDLAPDTDITLEYTTNILGDIGKINLSHSYTVKLPKTARNARILDDPGAPAHDSYMTRRFLTARYYRNGVDLLGGTVRAYILRTTPEEYEIALVWNSMQSLEDLSGTKKTLNDIEGLPVLRWVGANGASPDYTGGDSVDGAIHAWYNSGLGLNYTPRQINAATHPSMKMSDLFGKIMDQAGVVYKIHSEAALSAMANHVMLAAPSRKPSREMEEASGTRYSSTYVLQGGDTLVLTAGARTDGWDPVADNSQRLTVGSDSKHRVLVNIQAPASDAAAFDGVDLVIKGYDEGSNGAELARAAFVGGGCLFDEEVEVSGCSRYSLELSSSAFTKLIGFQALDPSRPQICLSRVHESINLEKDNRFPIAGNLPDIGQWDFVKACLAFYGLTPVIRGGTLHLYGYDDIMDLSEAYDWTTKVDMTDGAPQEMRYAVDGWAQVNAIAFEENEALTYDPSARIETDDKTLKAYRNWYELPFSASQGDIAPHYKQTKDGTFESTDMTPRVFRVKLGHMGIMLTYADDMYGEGLRDKFYSRIQKAMRRPVTLSMNIRLHELDLAQLDLSRPVYLRQFGRYYAILKIQTSGSDLCKVELLQLP